jgi:hypothetical protein
MEKYTPKDSTNARVKALEGAAEIAVPLGVSIATKAARQLWDQFTATRPEWLETHLITLGKIIHLELRIRKESVTLENEDVVVENRFGDVKENPRLAAIDRMIKQQASLIRLIGLNVNNDESAKLNRQGKKTGQTSAEGDTKKEKLKAKLLALPGGRK